MKKNPTQLLLALVFACLFAGPASSSPRTDSLRVSMQTLLDSGDPSAAASVAVDLAFSLLQNGDVAAASDVAALFSNAPPKHPLFRARWSVKSMALHFKWRETKSVGDIVSAASADMVSRWSTEKSPVISMYARDSEIDEDLLLSKASTLAKAEMNAIRSPVWDDGSFRPARTGGLKP